MERRRVRRTPATELLSRTDLGIAEIALRCGYADQSCLRSLRRRHGVTPAALRRAARSGKAVEPRGGGA